MIEKSLSIIIFFIFFLYLLGDVFFQIFFSNLMRKINIFLRLSFAWILGNSIFSIFLMFLFAIKCFHRVNFLNFIYFFIFIFCIWIYFFIKQKRLNNFSLNYFIYLILIFIFFLPLILNSLTSFLIEWDAVAIWFLKAKALFLENNFLNYLKSNNWLFSSQAYPIGIPLVISSYYRLINNINDQSIQLYFLTFYLNLTIFSLGILIDFFEKKINKIILLLTLLSFYISSNIVVYSHNGYVDLLLGSVFAVIFYFLYLFLNERESELKTDLLKMIIIASGYSLMIKNEAIPFILITFFILIINLFINLEKINRKKIIFFAPYVIVFFFPFNFWQVYLKVYKIPSFLDGHYLDFIKIENLARLKTIFNYCFLEIFNTNKYNLSFIMLILLFIYQTSYLILNKKISSKIILLFFLFFGQFLSYIYIYLVTPLPFIVQLETSLERLILQVLPMFFILNGVLLKEILSGQKRGKEMAR